MPRTAGSTSGRVASEVPNRSSEEVSVRTDDVSQLQQADTLVQLGGGRKFAAVAVTDRFCVKTSVHEVPARANGRQDNFLGGQVFALSGEGLSTLQMC